MEKFVFHHIGIAVQNLKDAIPIYKSLFGYELISGPFDDALQNVSVCFLSRGEKDARIELVAPLGANSPVDLVLKKGGGTYHICYEVQNIGSAIDHLREQGCFVVCDPVPAAAFNQREIAWLMTDVSLLVELLQA
jgi:methylmalonyl-CoA/ethylmalonyl-CoA epimerase